MSSKQDWMLFRYHELVKHKLFALQKTHWFTFDTLFYMGCQVGNHRQFPKILAALCSSSIQNTRHPQGGYWEQSNRHHSATLSPMAHLHLECCTHFWSHWCSRTFLMFLQYSSGFTHCDLLRVALLSLSELYCLNTCAFWPKDKFCLCLLRFSRNQNFSSSCSLLCHGSFLWKTQLDICRED